jgi:putative nucleotidyltransferase with HDIG domain
VDDELISALLQLVQYKDAATAAHTWRVTLYTLALAEAAGVDRDRHPVLMRAAVLHDIGKIDIPRRIVQRHPRLGYERLVELGEQDPVVLQVVRSHHERLDGSGYPDGLKGDEIPVPARRFAVIDSFDAMTSRRPYRQQVGAAAADRAVRELQARAGSWYAPEAVELLTTVYRSGDLDWILHHLNDEQSLIELPPTPDAASMDDARARVDQRHSGTEGVEIEVARARDRATSRPSD